MSAFPEAATPTMPWETALGIFLGATCGAALAQLLIFMLLRPVVSKTRNLVDDDLIAYLRWPCFFLCPSVAALVTLPVFAPFLSWSVQDLIYHLFVVVLLAILTWTTVNLARAITNAFRRKIQRQLLPLPDPRPYARARTQLIVISRAVYVILILLGLCAVVWSLPGGGAYGISLLASAGVASLVLGLASRPVLENLISSLQIALTQPISLEDYLTVDGVSGWVEEIGWQFVILRAEDHRRIVFPLSRFISGAFVENWTRTCKDGIVTLDLGVIDADEATLQEWRSRLRRVAEESGLWDGKVCVVNVVGSSTASASDSTGHAKVRVQACVSCGDVGRDVVRLRSILLEGLLVSGGGGGKERESKSFEHSNG